MEKTTIKLTKDDLMKPKELLEKYPDCGLDTRKIGFAVHCGAIAGVKLSNLDAYSIYEPSFLAYIEFMKTVPAIVTYVIIE